MLFSQALPTLRPTWGSGFFGRYRLSDLCNLGSGDHWRCGILPQVVLMADYGRPLEVPGPIDANGEHCYSREQVTNGTVRCVPKSSGR